MEAVGGASVFQVAFRQEGLRHWFGIRQQIIKIACSLYVQHFLTVLTQVLQNLISVKLP